jgi:POT family proton-dependent oligopeptide transporter
VCSSDLAKPAETRHAKQHAKQRTSFFGHPLGLLNIFSTELCERFSYYGMRAILVFYLYTTLDSGGLGLSETDAMVVMSLFGSLVYLSSIIGGWLSDRVLGSYRSVLIGGIIIASGHAVLGLPFALAGTVLALFLIVVGTGLLKPNVSVMVGALYAKDDPRRQAGFSLLYMSINIGGFISPLVVGFASQAFGYHIAFVIPAVFMVLGIVCFAALGKRMLAGIGRSPVQPLAGSERRRWFVVIAAGSVVAVVGFVVLGLVGVLNTGTTGNLLFTVCAATALALFIFIIKDRRISSTERSRMFAYIPLFIAATCFFAIAEQQSSTIPLIVDNYIDNDLGFFKIPPAWYASINPLVIIILSPVFAAIWTKLGIRQPSIFVKLTIGIILASTGFVLLGMAFATQGGLPGGLPDDLQSSLSAGAQGGLPGNLSGGVILINPLWIIAALFLITVGELFISPTGLAATTLLSPAIHISKMMGLWFIANALGQGINAIAVRFFDLADPGAFYLIYAAIALATGMIILAISKKLLALAKGVR